jgi:hypothetical protein
VQLITITTKIGDPLEDNSEVEDDIHEEIVGGIFMENDEKEKTWISPNIFLQKSYACHAPKKTRGRVFFQVGVSDVG